MPRSLGCWTCRVLTLTLLALPQLGCVEAEPLAPHELAPAAPQAQGAVTDAELSRAARDHGDVVVW